ncbi:hypothetical protein BpHYR1_040530 [Brachionus plicatilis]|uniref:Uncharacterized protein n=1 Tax=Brachionus plicatilis TaxID=10195 RepID=A0A3M7RN08_BRAPC|nr:hypothetical protein BpHYR1_040530 [Brachionus plicatilis]
MSCFIVLSKVKHLSQIGDKSPKSNNKKNINLFKKKLSYQDIFLVNIIRFPNLHPPLPVKCHDKRYGLDMSCESAEP